MSCGRLTDIVAKGQNLPGPLCCALTSLACAILLLRGYFRTRVRLLWDREEDAVQFRNALAPKKDALPHFWRVAHRGRLVQAVSASDEQLAASLRDLLGGEEPPAEEAADVASTKAAELHSPP